MAIVKWWMDEHGIIFMGTVRLGSVQRLLEYPIELTIESI